MIQGVDWQAVVAEANLAPSVHNTQPTRWQVEGDAIHLSLEPARLLTIGDPEGRDARFSLGAAWQGTRLALQARGLDLADAGRQSGDPSGRCITGQVLPSVETPLPRFATGARVTWRGGFADAPDTARRALYRVSDAAEGATLITKAPDLAHIAALNDTVSHGFFRDAAYRGELLSWMRLSRANPHWTTDGLNARALGLSRVEAWGANIALRKPFFDLLDAIGVAGGLIGEAEKTLTATGILLFHRPRDEDPLDSGSRYYLLLLALASAGFATWPMAVLADNPDTRADLERRFDIPDHDRLLTALRVGALPSTARPGRARLPVADLLIGHPPDWRGGSGAVRA